MSDDFDLEPLLDYMEKEVVPEWVIQKDRKKELLAEGKPFESTVVEDLDEVLELMYEKQYRKALECYIAWLLKEGVSMYLEDIDMLTTYGAHFGMDPERLKELRVAYGMEPASQ